MYIYAYSNLYTILVWLLLISLVQILIDLLLASSEKSVPVSALKEDKMNENVRHEIDERLVF